MRTGRILILWAVVVAACTPAGSGTSSTVGPYDLEDSAVLARLGVPAPSQIDWRRSVEGIEVVGIDTSPDPEELTLLQAALGEVPQPVLAAADPRHIIRVAGLTAEDPAHVDARAFALGPDVYLINSTFAERDAPLTRLDLTRALIHELAHVGQFRTLVDDYVASALAGDISQVEPGAGSELVIDFAARTGWTDTDPERFTVDWHLGFGQPATLYGGQDPAEDMAESVAMVALGRADWISADRVSWVEEWLDARASTLAVGKPWAPPGSSEVLSASPVYDEVEIQQLAARYEHAEPLYFQLPSDVAGHRELANDLQAQLGGRDLVGVLQRVDDDRLPRYAGLFSRPSEGAFWVELWDFREAQGFGAGPDTPILTYVDLW